MIRPFSLLLCDTVRLWGGAERFVLDAALGLRRRGHEITVQAWPESPLLRRAQAEGLTTLATRTRADGAPWTVLPLALRLHRHPVDAVWTTRDKDLRTTGLAARLCGRPTAVIHSRECDEPVKARPHYRVFLQRVAHRIVVNSRATGATTLHSAPWLDPSRLTVLPKGIDPAAFGEADPGPWPRRLGRRPGEVVVGFAGQLVPRKNVDLLLDLLAGETLRRRPWRLAVAGVGPAEADLRRRTHRLGLASRVVFCGFVEEMAPWLAAVDLLVLPSIVEGFGYVLAEAMAAGRPVVAFAASSVPEVVPHGRAGLLAPPGDGPALARALARLCDDADLRRRFGEEGRRVVAARHGLDRMLDGLEEVVSSTLPSNPPPKEDP